MLVRDVMRPNPVTVTPETTLPEALRLTAQRGIRHLPVLRHGELVGIVSDRDLKRAMASSATSLEAHEFRYLLDRLCVREIMTGGVVTIGPMMPIEEAARLMVQERIGALPVTEAGQLVGIVTETDVLTLFVRAMGVGEPSSRLDVPLGDAPGALAEVARLLADAGVAISSIVTLRGADGRREAVVRVPTIDPRPAIRALASGGYHVREGERVLARSAP
jgi:acetoin utilization protein AcuB